MTLGAAIRTLLDHAGGIHVSPERLAKASAVAQEWLAMQEVPKGPPWPIPWTPEERAEVQRAELRRAGVES